MEGIVDVVGVVLQAEPEAGFLKDAIENIDAQETKDKPTLVGAGCPLELPSILAIDCAPRRPCSPW